MGPKSLDYPEVDILGLRYFRVTQESMSLKYEPASELLHISVKWLVTETELGTQVSVGEMDESPSSAEMCIGSFEGSHLRLIDFCIIQL